MSYAMTHLIIAAMFAENVSVGNRDLFLLGSIAPDSVHSRADFTKRLKAQAHYLQEEENWGEVYEEAPMIKWYDMLKAFYREKSRLAADAETEAFLKGYTLHILTDIFNCCKFYAPSWMKFGLDRVDEFRKVYRNECILQDNWLYQTNPKSAEITQAISRAAEAFDLAAILSRLGLDKFMTADNIRDVVAYHLKNYEQASPVSLEGLNFVSECASHSFISEVEAECESLLFALPEVGRRFKTAPAHRTEKEL